MLPSPALQDLDRVHPPQCLCLLPQLGRLGLDWKPAGDRGSHGRVLKALGGCGALHGLAALGGGVSTAA